MSGVNNSILVKRVIEALFAVAGRRTLDSYAIQVLKTVVKKLSDDYEFFHAVEIQDTVYAEGGVHVTVDTMIDTVEPERLGSGIDALIRVMYMNLLESSGQDAGLFFVNELKEYLKEDAIEVLLTYGIDFEQIQTEQHQLYRGMEKKPFDRRPKMEREEDELHKMNYSWDTVSTWKYDNNVCFLYDRKGTLLDRLELDLIIEDYVQRLTEFRESASEKTTVMNVSSKENEFLALLRERDINIESAMQVLDVSRQKLEVMLHKLVNLEMLEYVSEKEVKLTEKGLHYLSEKQVIEKKG